MHTTNKWTIPEPGAVKVIHIDIDPDEIGRNYPTEVAIIADAKVALACLLDEVVKLQPQPLHRQERYDAVAESVGAWRRGIAAMQRSDASPVVPQRLIWELMEFLDDDTILLGDLSFSSVWMDVHYDVRKAGRNITYARGFDLLGWGLPASLGAKLAAPDRKVLSLMGDGSVGYCIGELETARRHNIATVNVVLNNGTLGYEKFLIKYFNEPGKITPEWPACDFADTDYAAIARAFGCVGIRVEHPSQLRPALEQAFASERPAVIDVVIDPEIIPPITFFPEEDRSL
jgi:acetolactate synthase-1/2/3 large subunit